jgi:hypothetical protein
MLSRKLGGDAVWGKSMNAAGSVVKLSRVWAGEAPGEELGADGGVAMGE